VPNPKLLVIHAIEMKTAMEEGIQEIVQGYVQMTGLNVSIDVWTEDGKVKIDSVVRIADKSPVAPDGGEA
jgi:hypothetical protein